MPSVGSIDLRELHNNGTRRVPDTLQPLTQFQSDGTAQSKTVLVGHGRLGIRGGGAAGCLNRASAISILRLSLWPPALLAFGLLVGRRREFRAWLRDDCLEVEKPALKIPYSEIEGLTDQRFCRDPDLPRMKRGRADGHAPQRRCGDSGNLECPDPKGLSGDSRVLPATGSSRLSQAFSAHFQKEAAMFGAERVHGFSRRKVIGRRPSTRRGQLCAASLLFCGILWCLAYAAVSGTPAARQYEPWLVFGILLSVFSLFGWVLILYLMQQPLEGSARNLQDAELIVSPTGIAVHQGDIQGHLRWEELLDVRFSKAGPFRLCAQQRVRRCCRHPAGDRRHEDPHRRRL